MFAHFLPCMYVRHCDYQLLQATAEDAIATAVEALDMYADVCKVGILCPICSRVQWFDSAR